MDLVFAALYLPVSLFLAGVGAVWDWLRGR